jgi:hypothetical protein
MIRDRQAQWAVVIGAASMFVTLPAQAGDVAAPPPARLPAVSGLNGKVEAQGGYQQGDGRAAGAGSITLPLGLEFGAQADIFAGTINEDWAAGAGGHLFWRDPGIGLLGVYGSYSYFGQDGDTELGRIGPEAELYLDRITLSGTVGAQLGEDAREDVYAITDFAYYPVDDLRLSLGYRFTDDGHGAAAGAEMQVYSGDGLALSLFSEGRVSEDHAAAWAGLRLYFGADKPLIRRHREDDPPNYTSDDLYSLTAGHQPDTERQAPPPPPPTPGGGGGE